MMNQSITFTYIPVRTKNNRHYKLSGVAAVCLVINFYSYN